MTINDQPPPCVLYEAYSGTKDMDIEMPLLPSAGKRTYEIVWSNVFICTLLHMGGIYGAVLIITDAMWSTRFFMALLYVLTALGITAGSHRLWAHKSYKARLPLRIILMILNTMASQGSAINWAHDHRMHHKFSETDADPYNPTRGLFFSHVGWFLVKKHPRLKELSRTIDMSDLAADPVLRFQKKYYTILMPLLSAVIPVYVATLWNETIWTSFFVCVLFRCIFVLNVTWLLNSAGHYVESHKLGEKPYDKTINPIEIKPIAVLALGESFHNYHHTFPWDYKTAEMGHYGLNLTTFFIDIFAKIDWAYDLKSVPKEVIERRVKRTGDGTHPVWGWDDVDVYFKDKKEAVILNSKLKY